MIDFNKQRVFFFSFSVISVILLLICFFCEGTGGGGDSTYHYLYAKYALEHPENFFDHWAKPIFTILAFPFAQFGFIGMKFFNLLMSLIACYFSYKTLRIFKTENTEWIAVILFSITLFVTNTFSGLTEPLSAAILMYSIYLILNNKTLPGVSVISFLPFVRSEGLIILGVFFIYLIVTKKYKYIVWLALGHLVMSIIGSFYYRDFLWVFSKIPYAHISSVYGKGTWNHFVEQLFFQMGLIEYSLLIIGGISMVVLLIKQPVNTLYLNEKLWLIYGCFIAFFIAHTSFWALGIFNSMGLSRVFVSVMPLMAIIVLDGINFIITLVRNFNYTFSIIVKYIILGLIVIFPFLNNPASYILPDDFELENTQSKIKKDLVPYIKMYKKNKIVITSDITVAYFLDIDVFDKKLCKMYYDIKNFDQIDSNEIIVWDNWFATMEFNTPFEKLSKSEKLKLDTLIYFKNKNNREMQFAIFSKK